jgi:lysophospholipase L1-like esterase
VVCSVAVVIMAILLVSAATVAGAALVVVAAMVARLASVMVSARVAGGAVNDLHALVPADPRAFQSADGVHMTDEGYRSLAQAVAAAIRAAV